jgi:hypothetical protein
LYEARERVEWLGEGCRWSLSMRMLEVEEAFRLGRVEEAEGGMVRETVEGELRAEGAVEGRR